MCTVTYVRHGECTILTSNRDEHKNRPAAIHPEPYVIGNKELTFPKDPLGGGSWFAIDGNTTIGVLLNGAADRHISQPFYRKSRGLVLLDIIAAKSPVASWAKYDLNEIEPFTIILSLGDQLYQLRWDGLQKETQELSVNAHYIWSSSTLYAPEVRQERELWFRDFMEENPQPGPEDMRFFHSNTARDNRENGLVINRNDIMKTFSITQAVTLRDKTEMFHRDLLQEQTFSNSFITV
ncbi:NRDE family protein [Dyadobacter sp.]|uniref:NRDE family protein n=1 Tax=Dyadobacter sp. TaxID=1914288 RepID=UPI003F728BD5